MVIDFAAARAAASLEEVARRYTTLNRSLQGPCPLCADGGHDRFYILKGGERCGCRRCGFSGDVIDLVAAVERISKSEAVRVLTGRAPETAGRPGKAPRRPVEAHPAPEPTWEPLKMEAAIQRAAEGLQRPGAKHARQYLADRGLEQRTIDAFRLGFAPTLPGKAGRWRHGPGAIVIPWIGDDQRLAAVKYRVLEHDRLRYIGEPGGRQAVFGSHAFSGEGGRSDYLAVLEGEFNAMSAWQALAAWNVDVVSIGSEANRSGIDEARRLAAGRRGVLVWMDEPERATMAAQVIARAAPVQAMRSPDGLDANDILARGGIEGLRTLILKVWEVDPFSE